MSVRKRTWKTSKGETKEAFVVDYRDQNGDRALQTFQKKGDAVSFWAQVKKAVDEGNHIAPSKSETVAQAAERWIAGVEAVGRERATVRQYRQHINLHIVPEIGGLKIATLTEARLEKFCSDLLQKLSRPLARKVLTSVKSVLRIAKRSQIAVNVKIPRDKRQRKLEVGKDIPTPQEIQRLLKASEGADLKRRALLAVAIFTGLRASELRGLRWRDVDFKNGEIHVRQRADRFNAIGAPKSETSARSLDVGPQVLAVLKGWKLACPKGEGDLVFPTAKGVVEHHNNMLRSLTPIMKAAGLMDGRGEKAEPRYGLHSLRHYFVHQPEVCGWSRTPTEERSGVTGT